MWSYLGLRAFHFGSIPDVIIVSGLLMKDITCYSTNYLVALNYKSGVSGSRNRSGRSGNCLTNISEKITNNQKLVIISIVAIEHPAQPGTFA